MGSDYAIAMGQRLRRIRNQQQLSLQAVQARSAGRWKAVVIASYERGDRAVTVQRLAELADFYGVPVVELLPGPRPHRGGAAGLLLILDTQRLAELPEEQGGPLARFVTAIRSQRADPGARMITLRSDDLKPLAILYDLAPAELADQLIAWGVLSAVHPERATEGD